MIGSPAIKKILRRSKLAKATAKQKLSPLKPSVSQGQTGFTLVELLVVVIMIGVLAVIAAPNWVGFVNQRRVNAANDTVLRAIQDAQSQAKTKKVSYSVSFRTPAGQAPEIAVYATQTAVNPTGTNPGGIDNVNPSNTNFKGWKSLGEGLGLKPRQVTLWTNIGNVANNNNNRVVRSAPGSGADIGTITFDEMGALSPDFGNTPNNFRGLIVMVAVPNGTNPVPSTQRCVIVKTLLGSLQIQKGSQCNF